jgi:hypothetical protein
MNSPGPGTAKPLSSSGPQKLSTKSTNPTWGFGTSRVSHTDTTVKCCTRHGSRCVGNCWSCARQHTLASAAWLPVTCRLSCCFGCALTLCSLLPRLLLLQRLAEYCNDSPGPGTYYA